MHIPRALLLLPSLVTALFVNAQTRPNLNVLHYAVHLKFDQLDGPIQAVADIEFEVTQKTKEFTLDLQSLDENNKGMRIESVEMTDALAWKHLANVIKIGNIKDFEPGKKYHLTIKYGGVPADGLIISKNQHGNPTAFGDNWPNRAHHWFPCNDHPADKATVEFVVDAPQALSVVSNGVLVKDSIISKLHRRTHWKTEVPLPTKVMVVGIANFAVSEPCQTHGIDVTSWVFEEQKDDGFKDYAPACDILGWYMDKMGSYPFEKLANVQSKTRYGGMENASCIFYFEKSVSGEGKVNNLIAHEIAHQWFGNSASEKDWPHLWLSEGFATYLTDLYVLEVQGEETFKRKMSDERDKVLKFYQVYQAPIVDTLADHPNKILNPNSYEKAAWVLHMLRNKLGDDMFWKCLRAYYQKYKLSNAATPDFIRVVNNTSGKDYTAFFRQWLRTTGHPDLEIAWGKAGKNGVVLTITQQQRVLFDTEVAILFKGKKSEIVKTVSFKERVTQIELPIGFKVKEVILDPEVALFFNGNLKKE